MKSRVILSVLAAALVVGTLSMLAPASQDETGNLAPGGAHYNLNIIGVKNPKNVDPDELNQTLSNGRRIFVPLSGTTRIMLAEGEFDVLDYDGTDGTAVFQLPNPDPENDGVTTYSVYVRGLGKLNGGSATIQPGVIDGDEEYYSLASVTVSHTKGSKFVNVSKELLYIYLDLDGDGTVERYPLFDDTFDEYFWDYINSNLKLAQLRFYEIPTDVN